MLSHKNVISQVLQVCTFESQSRGGLKQHVSLGLLPQSHIYGLTVICHASVYRGDEVIVLPRFTLGTCLSAVQRYGITSMFLVSHSCRQLIVRLLMRTFAGAPHHHLHVAKSRSHENV